MPDREFWEKCGFTMEKSTVEGVDTWYTSFYPDGTQYMQTEEEGLIHLLFPLGVLEGVANGLLTLFPILHINNM